MTNEIKSYYCLRFTKKSGKVNKLLQGKSSALLKLYALNNTPKTMECIIFDVNGDIHFHTVGKENDLPDVVEDECSIEDYSPGILSSLSEQFETAY